MDDPTRKSNCFFQSSNTVHAEEIPPGNIQTPSSLNTKLTTVASLLTIPTGGALPKTVRNYGQRYNHGVQVSVKDRQQERLARACNKNKCSTNHRVVASQVTTKGNRQPIAQNQAMAMDMMGINAHSTYHQSTLNYDENEQHTGGKPEPNFPRIGFQTSNKLATNDDMKVKALMVIFRLPADTDFLVYMFLKENFGDLKQTSAKIVEAQCELRSWEQLREAVRGLDSVSDDTKEPDA